MTPMNRRTFLAALAALAHRRSRAATIGCDNPSPGFLLGWNHPWYGYGHDFGGNLWGRDGIATGGWTAETFVDTRGFRGVEFSKEQACTGQGSLKIDADLRGGDPEDSSGEVRINLETHLPRLCPTKAEAGPQDLAGVRVSCCILLPRGAAGRSDAPNGIQFFFKKLVWTTRLSRRSTPSG